MKTRFDFEVFGEETEQAPALCIVQAGFFYAPAIEFEAAVHAASPCKIAAPFRVAGLRPMCNPQNKQGTLSRPLVAIAERRRGETCIRKPNGTKPNGMLNRTQSSMTNPDRIRSRIQTTGYRVMSR